MPKDTKTTTNIQVPVVTRQKMDAIKAVKPAWNIGTIVDEAVDALAEKLGVRGDQRDQTPPQALSA